MGIGRSGNAVVPYGTVAVGVLLETMLSGRLGANKIV